MKYGFYLFAILYAVAPLIFVPYWAYHNSNWIFLFGILASYVGTAATWKFKTNAASGILIIIIISWIRGGFHLSNPYFFFLISFFWGSINFLFAGSYVEEIEKKKELDSEAKKIMQEIVKDEILRQDTLRGERLKYVEENEDEVLKRVLKYHRAHPGVKMDYDTLEKVIKGEDLEK